MVLFWEINLAILVQEMFGSNLPNQLREVQTLVGQIFNKQGDPVQLAKNAYFKISDILKQVDSGAYSTTPKASFNTQGNYQSPSEVAKAQGNPNPHS